MNEIEIIARAQQLEKFAYSQTPLIVSEITKRLNELVNTLKRVTDNGRSVGIISEQRVNQQGSTYEAISYNLNAQHFIVDNIHSIIELNRKKATKADEKRDG